MDNWKIALIWSLPGVVLSIRMFMDEGIGPWRSNNSRIYDFPSQIFMAVTMILIGPPLVLAALFRSFLK